MMNKNKSMKSGHLAKYKLSREEWSQWTGITDWTWILLYCFSSSSSSFSSSLPCWIIILLVSRWIADPQDFQGFPCGI